MIHLVHEETYRKKSDSKIKFVFFILEWIKENMSISCPAQLLLDTIGFICSDIQIIIL